MKKTIKLTKVMRNIAIIAVAAIIGFSITACKEPKGSKDLKYSLQVKNQAERAITGTDTVKLNIRAFNYLHDDLKIDGRGVGLVIIGDDEFNFNNGKGETLHNAGWYSADEDLPVWNTANNGKYSSFQIKITQLKVGDKIYDFPDNGDTNNGSNSYWGVIFGKPSSIWTNPTDTILIPFVEKYPANFQGMTISDSTKSLKTILTVEPDIIGTANSTGYDSNGLATDPYKYIKVEGRVNE